MSSCGRIIGLLFVLLLLALFAGFVSWTVGALIGQAPHWSVSVKSIEEIITGIGGGGCPGSYYDSGGRNLDNVLWEGVYQGPAPVYRIQSLPNIAGCDFPDAIRPAVAKSGDPVYPLVVTASIATEKLKLGESARLMARAALADDFEPGGPVSFSRPVVVTDTVPVSFSLHTTTFDSDPGASEEYAGWVDVGRPAQASWILSPKEGAGGSQLVEVHLDSTSRDRLWSPITLGVSLDVRHVTGLDLLIVRLASAASTFLVGLLTIARLFPETWNSYRELIGAIRRRRRRPLGF